MVYVPVSPAVKLPVWVLVILRSAVPRPVVKVSVDVLFPGTGSGVVEATVAVLTTVDVVCVDCRMAVRSMVVAVPAAASGPVAVQVTVWPVCPHTHPVPDADVKVSYAGRVSVTTGAWASDGPRFLTAMV